MIVDAVRTPFAKRGGQLADVHPADLLAAALRDLFIRTGVDPALVGQVIGGCVDQVREQALNVTRTAWLVAGLPEHVPATTVDTQCGSSHQAFSLGAALVASGQVEVAVACGVESMTRVPPLCNLDGEGEPAPPSYYDRYGEFIMQYEASERIARAWDVTRADADKLGLESQRRAHIAWAEGRFDSQISPVGTVTRDEGLRATSLEALAGLRPIHGDDGIHTAGSASQISDGASAVLIASPAFVAAHGLNAIASIVDSVLVGSDPIMMLTGPIPATRTLLERNRLSIHDIDVIEINEAFASVVLAWERELRPDMAKVNPNGGAIAMGHPVGATGTALVAKTIHELVRTESELGLITICCGGGLATGSVLRRIA